MQSILRSKGKTFTDKSPLIRGLKKTKVNKTLDHPTYNKECEVLELSDYLRNDPTLLVRQTIAVLDKVIKKPKSLKDFEKTSYIDRCKLADALWKKIEIHVKNLFKDKESKLDITSLEKLWQWKVHPYITESDNVGKNPSYETILSKLDEYANKTTKFNKDISNGKRKGRKQPLKKRQNFEGRWHQSLWQESGINATADAIWYHLTEKAAKISNKARTKKIGLLQMRADSISSSIKNPFEPRKVGHYRNVAWPDQCPIRDLYFEDDIAKEIFEYLCDQVKDNKFRIKKSDFGRLLYEHFSRFVSKIEKQENKKWNDISKEVTDIAWSIHNTIRLFYGNISKSEKVTIELERYRKRTRELNNSKRKHQNKSNSSKVHNLNYITCNPSEFLSCAIPTNSNELTLKIKEKHKNSEIGELISLGKIIVHASDIPFSEYENIGIKEPDIANKRDYNYDYKHNEDLEKKFNERINYFISSEGQSEIKRNESFARVWRNSVAMSGRSLYIWSQPDLSKPIEVVNKNNVVDNDLSSLEVSKEALTNHFKNDYFINHASILFGNKTDKNNISRKSIIVSGSEDENRELLWTMLRISAEIRHRTNHFCTKQRIVDVLTNGVVKPHNNIKIGENFTGRMGVEVSKSSLEKLDKLLRHDISLVKQSVVDELNRIGFPHYVPEIEKAELLEKIYFESAANDLILPRFMSVLKQAQKIDGSDAVSEEKKNPLFTSLKLDAKSLSMPGINQFRVELLRKLYYNGFLEWLGGRDVSTEVKKTTRDKSQRTQDGLKLVYNHDESLLEKLGISESANLHNLMCTLAAEEVKEERLNETYNADAKKQQGVSNRIEKFKQELFKNLFESYLHEQKMDWLLNIKDSDNQEINFNSLVAEDIKNFTLINNKPWHSQFYAWLYMVPVDDIARLRHQFKKTAILEEKSDGETDEVLVANLGDIDCLMGLYAKINSAGFNGMEHIEHIQNIKFFEDEGQFKRLFDESDDFNYSGTRRGLREMLRFRSSTVLKDIIQKHSVLNSELSNLLNENTEDFARRIELHSKIVDSCKGNIKKGNNAKTERIEELCRQYEDTVIKTTNHNFASNAIRLTDFARLQQLLMRVTGRLKDYTLMWERDMYYLFLGLLYRQSLKDKDVSLVYKPMNTNTLNGTRFTLCIRDKQDVSVSKTNLGSDILIDLWDDKKGFCMPKFTELFSLLNEKNVRVFERYYYGYSKINKSKPTNSSVRNNFAHYNFLNDKSKNLSLNCQIDSVRSLFDYDKKLKNAVTKSVINILKDAGIDISWDMINGELSRTRAYPVQEQHLRMVPRHVLNDRNFRLPLNIPRVSQRYLSMALSLFDNNKGVASINAYNILKKTNLHNNKAA
ncbi:MAG: type VI-A CRISPR-associated RNA-guided ribonuclease Cas13a [Rickettsiales bacterium]|nr:type VI-A CRISPR-associated RNA-guided ribonuclease Cas13a [Pseudomonadota bacterium]MDG4544115.1 type VI-A CRISPR-associated RNA-guided ribonuclease Cas13a [Rickettsiales bacterium]MDG4546296.1 type VI-A CRISPR-associated RNA-guided ribonuclease Cas13a [Rickettsiales bacterium]MDG4548439.1 type VI-A CRISPR-associated RNA-guided ribonuclease Cas13a [Rickettsiales bacterium]